MPWEDFRTVNGIQRLNRALQIILALCLIGGLNYLANQYYFREDLTRSRAFSLSPETQAYLNSLNVPVRVIVTIAPDSPRQEERLLYRYTSELLEEYGHEALKKGKSLLDIEFVDVYQDLPRARELAQKYQIDQPNLIIVAGPDRQRILVPTDILEFSDMKPVAFKGEQALTSAILEVSEDGRPKIYWLQGHGEMRLEDVSPRRGLSEVSQEMVARNLSLEEIDLSQKERIPEDASLVVLAAPQGPLYPREVEILQKYLETDAGRLLILLSPGREHGLQDLFFKWGLQSRNRIILEHGEDFLEREGATLVRHFAQHPITDVLIRNQTPLMAGLWRPISENPASPPDERRQITALMASSKESWAESNWQVEEGFPKYDAGIDFQGPLPVAMLSERRDSGQLGIDIPGGRLLVFGNADWIANRHISAFGNYSLWFSTINWMLERDHLIALPARPIEKYQLALSSQDLIRFAAYLLIPPASLILIGLVVYLVRRTV